MRFQVEDIVVEVCTMKDVSLFNGAVTIQLNLAKKEQPFTVIVSFAEIHCDEISDFVLTVNALEGQQQCSQRCQTDRFNNFSRQRTPENKRIIRSHE